MRTQADQNAPNDDQNVRQVTEHSCVQPWLTVSRRGQSARNRGYRDATKREREEASDANGPCKA